MRCLTIPRSLVFCCVWAASACAAVPDFKALYNSQECFLLRDAVLAAKNPPLFYQAAVAFGLNDSGRATRLLRQVIRADPGSWEGKEAQRLLENLKGRMSIASPKRFSQAVTRRQPAKTHYSMTRGNLYLPVTVNGKQVNYLLDTGAGFSVVSEAEAKRLNLKLVPMDGQSVDGGTGKTFQFQHMGMAKKMTIAGVTLKNVVFMVFPDDMPFFECVPEGEQGIVGLPVLLALEAFRWGPNGIFETGFPPAPLGSAKPNLGFEEGQRLITEIGFEGSRLIFGLDLGAQGTGLYIGFRDRFADLVRRTGVQQSRKGGGITGMIDYQIVALRKAKLTVGEMELTLQPAEISLQKDVGSGHMGNLGLDLLNRAQLVTLDFRRMTLTLDGKQ